MRTTFPAALSIAGSDPSGGAGIQMDLKAFTATGVWGMAVITALTAQNAAEVTGSWPISPDIIREQFSAVLDDITPRAIKTGMLANAKIIRVVDDSLPSHVPLIVDPVMISTSGYRLLDDESVCDLCECLIPRAHLVTPNIPEAEILARIKILRQEDMITAATTIRDLGAKQVLIKGGHGRGNESIDYLIQDDLITAFHHPRLPYEVHGSGCFLSAAITGYIAHGDDDITACQKATDLINKGIKNALIGRKQHYMIQPINLCG